MPVMRDVMVKIRGCASFGLAVEALAGGAGGAGSAGHSKGWWRVCRRRVRRGLTGTHATRTGLDLSCGSPIRGAHFDERTFAITIS
jgi:hypothetical protein